MVKVSGLANEIAKQLSLYTEAVEEKVELAKEEVSKKVVDELKQTSPKLTGDYAKGWTRKKVGNDYVIHNRTKHQVTHLLEHGHVKAGGGRVAPRVHIRPAEEKAISEYIEHVEKAIEQ